MGKMWYKSTGSGVPSYLVVVLMPLVVKPVETSREKKLFLHLPWEFYKHDAYWIPPLQQNQKELTNLAPHPFYEKNLGQPFLALRDGKVVGRILAIVNYGHIERFQEQRGFFGFFECEDNQETADALFAAAKAWLKEKGMTCFRGPVNPSLNYECGLLVEGFDSSPFFMMTYNLPYYGKLIEGAGLTKTQDMYAFYGEINMLAGLDKKMRFVVEECKRRFKVVLRPIDKRRFLDEVRMFMDIYNRSLVGTWGFVPMSAKEGEHSAQALRYLLVPEMTAVAEVEGKPVGAVFGLLDYNPRIKQSNGWLFPFGILRMLWNRKAIKRIRLISTNVVPEFQRWGIGLLLLSKLLPDALKWGVNEAEFSWVLESNTLSYGSLKRGGAKITKTYRLYDGDL